jgi:hypothetical protein
MGNMQLLEACKATCKGGKSEKGTERKLGNTHLLKAWGGLHLKTTEKRSEKARKGRESDGKKDGQYAFSRNRQG